MTAPGKIEIRDTAPPVPGEGEVLLRVQRIGVCGSDVHVNHGRHPTRATRSFKDTSIPLPSSRSVRA